MYGDIEYYSIRNRRDPKPRVEPHAETPRRTPTVPRVRGAVDPLGPAGDEQQSIRR